MTKIISFKKSKQEILKKQEISSPKKTHLKKDGGENSASKKTIDKKNLATAEIGIFTVLIVRLCSIQNFKLDLLKKFYFWEKKLKKKKKKLGGTNILFASLKNFLFTFFKRYYFSHFSLNIGSAFLGKTYSSAISIALSSAPL